MGLIQEYIEIELSSSNINHYSKLGYYIPKIKRKNGKYVTPRGTKIKVLTTDLMKGSSEIVNLKCDCCGNIFKRNYYSYIYCNHNGLYYCNKCSSTILESGENNPRWNPNISFEERSNGRYSEKYINFIHSVFRRDNYTCQCCGKKKSSSVKIEAHHLDGFNWCIEKRTDINNGITLCKDCHRDFHNKYGIGNNTKEQYEEWIGHVIKLVDKGIEITSNRKVYCLETNIIYDSTMQLSLLINTDRTTVATACSSYKNWKNKNGGKIFKSLKGMHYFWYDEYINLSTKDIKDFLEACKNKHHKKVICLTSNKVFNTIKEGADFYNIKYPVDITNCCKGKSSYAGISPDGIKMKWMYYEDYINK